MTLDPYDTACDDPRPEGWGEERMSEEAFLDHMHELREKASMKRFQNGQRVQVNRTRPDLTGKFGTVVWLLHHDDSAWVAMDEDIPEELARFPIGDARRNHVNLWPDECDLMSEPVRTN